MDQPLHSWLRRLGPAAYQGYAAVHWTMAILPRRAGWLHQESHAAFRESLLHTLFQHRLACPIYCLMPDHLHLLLIGWDVNSDQRRAVQVFRRTFNGVLRGSGFKFQKQAFDHLLRPDERNSSAFSELASYIRANPQRADLIREGAGLPDYPYSGCLVPGYFNLSIWADDYWPRFWSIWGTLARRAERLNMPPT